VTRLQAKMVLDQRYVAASARTREFVCWKLINTVRIRTMTERTVPQDKYRPAWTHTDLTGKDYKLGRLDTESNREHDKNRK
jgi:hypothetical protein